MTKPKIHLIGNAHLDPTWLWHWQEGCSEVIQTFASALDRLSEDEDFIFTCSSVMYYKWVEEISPEMFTQIAQRIKEGRWIIVNGWYIQPDCNIPSGEAFARQGLYSQLYYHEKFGKICRTGYNVDSFGHSAMLPQLLYKSGMFNYCFMRPSNEENPNIPDVFIWESEDGSKVLSYHIPECYCNTGKEALDKAIDCAKAISDKTGLDSMLFYGVGNHGGGPTKWDISYLKQQSEKDSNPKMLFSHPDKYFNHLCANFPDLPLYKGELQHHASGCYSATSLVKYLNRKAENSLYASECFSTIATKAYSMSDKTKDFKNAWEEVCFNQFHDIICGCSIMEAYEDVKASMGHALNISAKMYNEAVLRIASQIDTWVEGVSDTVCREVRNQSGGQFPRPVVVFNPLSFDINVPVRAYNPAKNVTDSKGNSVPFQNVRSSRSNDTHMDTCFMAKVPALGYSTFFISPLLENEAEEVTKTDVFAEELTLENKYIKAVFCEKTGTIKSLINKETGYDYALASPLAVPTVIDDSKSDTWAHNVFTFHNVKGIMDLISIKLVEKGPARAVIRTKHKFNESYLFQDFILASNSKTLRVKCKAMWQEDFTMLKMSFKVNGENPESTYEIPGGIIKRNPCGDEEPAGKFGAVTVSADNKKHTLAIVNDSKYSYDCIENDLRITLLRNVIFADHFSHRPEADFNFTDEGKSVFEYGIYLSEGDAINTEAEKEAIMFNIRPTVTAVGYHKGTAPKEKSFLHISADNIIMTAFKLCEDGSNDVILRLAEVKGKETRTNVISDFIDCAFKADFMPLEIKTFRIDSEGKVSEENFLEGIVRTGDL